MSNTGFYICTECHWSGAESALHTKFSKHGDEQVCPNCGAFEDCIPQSEAVVISEGHITSVCNILNLQDYINLGWSETGATVQEFIKSNYILTI